MLDIIGVFSHSVRRDRIGFMYAIAFAFLFLTLGCRTAVPGSTPHTETVHRALLRVATSGDYPPFSHWPAQALAPVGFSISLAEAYAQETGASLQWIRFRWSELASDLAGGAFDLSLSGITVRPDRSMQGRFGLALTTSGAMLLVAADSPLESAADFDRPSIRLAVHAGGHLERVARRLFGAARIEAVADNASVLGRLLRGEVDAVVTDSLEAPLWQRIGQRRAGTRLRAIGPLTRDRKAAWFPPNHEAEAMRFNRWLLRAESTGLLEGLRREFGLPEGRTADPLPALLSSLYERLSLMPAVADAKHRLGAPIENPPREQIVLDAAGLAIRKAAREAGIVPPDGLAVRRLFRAQIEAAKWIQHRQLRNESNESYEASPDERRAARAALDEVLRPALLYLGDRISMLLIACLIEPPESLAYQDVARALEAHDLPESHLRAVYRALSEILKHETNGGPARRPGPAGIDKEPSGSTRTVRP